MYRHHESQTEAVLDAAQVLIESGGAEALTMRKLARVLGWTPMAAYHYFSTRDELLRALSDREIARLANEWQTQAGDSGMLDGFIDYALAHSNLYRCLFSMPREGARRFPEDFVDGQSPTLTLLVQQIETLQAAGAAPRDSSWELAFQIWALLHGYLDLYLSGRIGLEEPEFRALLKRALGRLYYDSAR